MYNSEFLTVFYHCWWHRSVQTSVSVIIIIRNKEVLLSPILWWNKSLQLTKCIRQNKSLRPLTIFSHSNVKIILDFSWEWKEYDIIKASCPLDITVCCYAPCVVFAVSPHIYNIHNNKLSQDETPLKWITWLLSVNLTRCHCEDHSQRASLVRKAGKSVGFRCFGRVNAKGLNWVLLDLL